jgi:hypothetical protein
MARAIDRWEFNLPEAPTRVATLEKASRFESIVDAVKREMTVLCCHSDPFTGRTDFRRVAYCVSVRRDTFDLFFNSRTGYRAAYFSSPSDGLAANQHALDVLSGALAARPVSDGSGLARTFIEESLRTPSAKIWLAEKGKEVKRDCPGCRGEWTPPMDEEPELLNGRWEVRSAPGAKWGRKVPYLTKLRILGAFLDENLNELIPAVKRFRAREIYDLGWS